MPLKNQEKTRRLAAIMFTDIVGYTALMQGDEARAVRSRTRHREVFEKEHKLHHGEILQYYGDGTLSVFQSAVEAVKCAILIQQELQSGEVVPMRIGLHLGDIVFDGTEVYGAGVNLAARIESMGIAGSILLSGRANKELRNHIEVSTNSLGQFQFKNISEPIEVFAIVNKGIKIPAPSQLKGKRKELNKTITVLPFINMSSSTENEYFCDGMTEEIINALAKIKELRVTSRTSSFYYKNKNIPIPQIGKELNVSIILEGSIRLSGKNIRVTAQLIDVKEDFHFWSETFDRSIEDIFSVQDEISLLIADKLREHIGHFELESHLIKDLEIPVEVYKKYLKGRFYLMKLSLPSTEKAISIFKEVIAERPNFPLPYLGINQGYTYLGSMGLLPAPEAFSKAKPFLDKALSLDKDLPESQLNLSWIACWQNWDLESAYRHICKALELRPTDEMLLTMSNLLTVEGKLDAAQNYIDKALQVDPMSAMNHHYKGFLYYLQEKYDKAIPYFEKSLQLKPELPFPHIYLGAIPLLTERASDGLAFFQNMPDTEGGNLTKLGGTVLAYAALGDDEKTKIGIAKLNAALETDSMGSAMQFLIMVKTMMKKYDEAIQLIEQAVSYKLPLALLIYTEPILKPLHSIPRFQKLMREIYGKKSKIEFSKRKYKKPLFDEVQLKKYRHQLEILMREKKPYLDPSLTIRSLAEIFGIPSNHLSQLLSEGFEKNFSEYINSYRVEAFKLKAADPKQHHLTILALAYDSGFNSKTVFNTFFKKMMGMTPKAYWKEVVK